MCRYLTANDLIYDRMNTMYNKKLCWEIGVSKQH